MTQEQDHAVERTLVLLKPDAVVHGFAGKIISRFEDAALKIVGVKMKKITAYIAISEVRRRITKLPRWLCSAPKVSLA